MTATVPAAPGSTAAVPRRRRSRARRAAAVAARPAAARPAGRSVASRPAGPTGRVLVLGCGALAQELKALTGHAGSDQPGGIDVECLPAKLHNRPALIAGEIRARLDRLSQQGRSYERILLGYGDCGSAGAIDELCDEFNRVHAGGDGPAMTRVPGAHCYEFLAGADGFAALSDDEPATFYLTDYLARHFDLLVWQGLGIADHPELAELYFGNYRRVVLLTQTPDDAERARVEACARAGAERLGLPLEVVRTGYGELAEAVTSVSIASGAGAEPAATVPATQRATA